MMATVPHVTSGSGLRIFQADGFLFDTVHVTQNWGTFVQPLLQWKSNKYHILCLWP